ncbi:uncharacterized protein EI90DRAFT_3037611 [Cantharellus anzutake]|uniref:uncharacterized protein n=1 Tax=Cantharellus anzutake TaxID=1750568 RepID=UPI001905CBD2|nr:uncharacterized protein EI90DRAFT_3037611 [Cantharellus anzutake]KAF8339736.1 hypothetical protein EI90DRAFT_3037611 [Cantharellus anzutake]
MRSVNAALFTISRNVHPYTLLYKCWLLATRYGSSLIYSVQRYQIFHSDLLMFYNLPFFSSHLSTHGMRRSHMDG